MPKSMLRRGESIEHGFAVDDDLALVRLLHSREQSQQRGLARAVFAEQHVDLAAAEVERHLVQGDDAWKALGYLA